MQSQKYQETVNLARMEWKVRKKIKLKIDNNEIDDPFTLGFIIAPKPFLYLRAKQIKKLKSPNRAIEFCIYHEMGHFKQWESKLLRRFDATDLIRSTYNEFTNETSTIILLCRKGLKSLVLINAKYYTKLAQKYLKNKPMEIKTKALLEYYPYVYAYKRAGEILKDSEIKNCYSQLKRAVEGMPTGKMETFFDQIKLQHRGAVYYVKKNLDKKLKQLEAGILARTI